MSDRSTGTDDSDGGPAQGQLQLLSQMTSSDRQTQAKEFVRRAKALNETITDQPTANLSMAGVKELDVKPRQWWQRMVISVVCLGFGAFLFWQGVSGRNPIFGLGESLFEIAGAILLLIGAVIPSTFLLSWRSYESFEENETQGFSVRIQFCDRGATAVCASTPPMHLRGRDNEVVTDLGEVQQRLDQFNGSTSRPEGVVRDPRTMLTGDASKPAPQTELKIWHFSVTQEIPAGRFEQAHSITDCAGADGTIAERTTLDELILAGESYDSDIPAVLSINSGSYLYGNIDTDAIAETRQSDPIDHPVGVQQAIRFLIGLIPSGTAGENDVSGNNEASSNQQQDLPPHAQALKATSGNFIFESDIYLISSARGTTQNQLAKSIRKTLESQVTTPRTSIEQDILTISAGNKRLTDIFKINTLDREPPTRSLGDPNSILSRKITCGSVPSQSPPPIRDRRRTFVLGASEMASVLTMTDDEVVRDELATGGTHPPTAGSSTTEAIEMDDPYGDDSLGDFDE